MNNIKFRVWYDVLNEMLQVRVINFKTGKITPYGWKSGYKTLFSKPMQYSGVNDIEDKEIYEEDIVYWEPMMPSTSAPLIGVVKQIDGAWFILNDKEQRGIYLWSEVDSVKLLGNTYKDHELRQLVQA